MQLPREVIVGKGTLNRAEEVSQRLDLEGPALIIAGSKSYEIAGKRFRDLLEQTGMNVETFLTQKVTFTEILAIENQIKKWKP
jgi:glycerol-1-phosphate dehydrogenase [NAD(P)+]